MVSDVPGPPEQLADAASPFLYLFLIISLRIRHVLEDAPPCAVIDVEIVELDRCTKTLQK